jgi:hypothetical protein
VKRAHSQTAAMQSADLLDGKAGTADPTEPIELIEDLAELDKGSSKTPWTCFYKEVHVGKIPKKIDKNSDVTFSSVLKKNRVFGCFSAMGVQKHYNLD